MRFIDTFELERRPLRALETARGVRRESVFDTKTGSPYDDESPSDTTFPTPNTLRRRLTASATGSSIASREMLAGRSPTSPRHE